MKLLSSNSMEMTWSKSLNLHTWVHGRKQLKQCKHPCKNHQDTKLIWKATECMEGQGSLQLLE